MKRSRTYRARTPKTPKQLERHLKGVANHYRISILLLIAKNPKLSVDQIALRIRGNYKTMSEHIRRLTQAGLIEKKYQGHEVCHTLSPYGRILYDFIISFSNS